MKLGSGERKEEISKVVDELKYKLGVTEKEVLTLRDEMHQQRVEFAKLLEESERRCENLGSG